MSDSKDDSGRGTQSLDRAIGLLKEVAAHSRRGLRITDLVMTSGMERPTAHRMLQSLVKHGLISRLKGSKRYVLGDYCRELAAAFADRSDLRSICEPVLRGISEETGNSSFLIVRMGMDSLCVARSIGSYPIQVLAMKVGNRQPLGVGAGGLAILATLPKDEREECIRKNAHRLSGYGALTVSTLQAITLATIKRGHAVIGHYSVPGVIAVGVALRNSSGAVVGAITTASLDSRMSRAEQQRSLLCVERHVQAVQQQLDTLS
ncbi:IclR family transcriptional regulator [Cupriavidus lacunae]|uniref:IclR family transcriptional regulator n=1 Tax=Cupriavidus lacunae TaxID=2666307 RepID=A0A370NWV6_9BURK|nr:IclR family transcriptional regulator [Cupriavidus lacunae]